MQFAQSAVMDLRQLNVYDTDEKESIDKSIAMHILNRFFVKGGTHEIVASELHLEYGMELQMKKDDFVL